MPVDSVFGDCSVVGSMAGPNITASIDDGSHGCK